MTRTFITGATAFSLALGACADRESAADPSPENEVMNDMAPAGSATNELNEAETADATIPDIIRGTWGMTPNDCDATRADAKGRMEIDATSIRFYESVAQIGEVKERDDSRIVAGFDFTGEGMTWSREITLDAQEDGRSLTRRETGAEASPGPYDYNRCA